MKKFMTIIVKTDIVERIGLLLITVLVMSALVVVSTVTQYIPGIIAITITATAMITIYLIDTIYDIQKQVTRLKEDY